MSWAWGGDHSSRSSQTRASNIARSGRNNRANIDSTEVGDPYGSDRPDADRSTGAGRTFYSIGNINAWNRYQDNLRALESHQNTYGTREVDSDGNVLYRYSSQQMLNTARALRASVFDYQEDTRKCDSRDPDACRRVGRYVNRRTGEPPEQYRGNAMGGGSYVPNETEEPVGMGDGSGSGSGDGSADMQPPEAPAVEDREGEASDNPHEAHSGASSMGHHEHDNQKHRDPVSGGGTHDGSAGRASHGDQTVHPLEPVGNNNKKRRLNKIRRNIIRRINFKIDGETNNIRIK